jgi:hypothetical protein
MWANLKRGEQLRRDFIDADRDAQAAAALFERQRPTAFTLSGAISVSAAYKTRDTLGGTLVTAHDTRDGRAIVCLFGASGDGTAAALLLASARAYAKALAPDATSPVVSSKHPNALLARASPRHVRDRRGDARRRLGRRMRLRVGRTSGRRAPREIRRIGATPSNGRHRARLRHATPSSSARSKKPPSPSTPTKPASSRAKDSRPPRSTGLRSANRASRAPRWARSGRRATDAPALAILDGLGPIVHPTEATLVVVRRLEPGASA